MSNNIARLVNLVPVALEPPGDVKFTYESVPGLKNFAYLTGEARGGIETNDRYFVIFGSSFCELYDGGTFVSRGTLGTSTGTVSMSAGNFQVVMVDGPSGYVFSLTTGTFAQITDPDFQGSDVVRYMALRFLFVRPGSGQMYWSQIDDASDLDALDFVTFEDQPDNLVGLEVDHAEIYGFGKWTTQIFFASDTEAQFQKSQGSGMEVGCVAAQSIKQIDNSIFFIGRDKSGFGIVYRVQGHQPVRVSTHDQEEAIQAEDDPSAIVAYVYQDKGLTFYCFNVADTTWCYEVSTGTWSERCDLDSAGNLTVKRTTVALFAFNKHLEGAKDGHLWELDSETYKNGDDPLVRELTTSYEVDPQGRRLLYSEFVGRFETGGAAQGDDPQVELSWTDDRGKSWANWILRSLGKVGERFQQLLWTQVGGDTRERAWRIRFSGDAPYSIRSFNSRKRVGSN